MSVKATLAKAAEIKAVLKKFDATTGNRTCWTVETQQEVAEFFGVSLDTVKNWAKQKMPGKRGEYLLHKIYQWLHTEGPRSNRFGKEDEDPLLSGGSSPALEEYRLWKAKLARLDYEQRNKELIPRDQVRTVLARWSMVFRRLGESLGRQFGNEATRKTHDALDECGRLVYELSGDSTSDASRGFAVGAESGESPDSQAD